MNDDVKKIAASIYSVQRLRLSLEATKEAITSMNLVGAEMATRMNEIENMLLSVPDYRKDAAGFGARVQELANTIALFGGLSDVVIEYNPEFYDEETTLKSIVFYLKKEVERMESKGMEMNEAYFGQEFGNESIVISGNVAKFILQKLSK